MGFRKLCSAFSSPGFPVRCWTSAVSTRHHRRFRIKEGSIVLSMAVRFNCLEPDAFAVSDLLFGMQGCYRRCRS